MTIREVRAEAENRSSTTVARVEALTTTLTRFVPVQDARCAMCARTAELALMFVLPVTYIASCLVQEQLEDAYLRLPLRCAPLCDTHRAHFTALFVDVGDVRWDLTRLERRAEVLGGVLRGDLLIFGGPKALLLVAEFHEAVAALKVSVKHTDP